MERVALARLVNAEIRALAERLATVEERDDPFAWVCACGCFTIVTATLTEYDATDGQVFAAGHPLDQERAAATAAFQREPDPSAVVSRVDEKRRRRELTTELTRRLERQIMADNGAS
jgi:hypothetical protein